MLRKPITSEEERRTIRSLAKKKQKVNIYFNKKKNGTPKYFSGVFHSKKNDENFQYRSSYELAYFYQLEDNEEVISYMYEPFKVSYIDFYKVQKNYIPDLMVLYKDGSIDIAEIKPTSMLSDFDVQAKAASARKYIKENYKDLKVTYKFITEKQIFANNTEYLKFLAEVKSKQF